MLGLLRNEGSKVTELKLAGALPSRARPRYRGADCACVLCSSTDALASNPFFRARAGTGVPEEVQNLIGAVCERNKTGVPLPADVRQRVDKLTAPLVAEETAAAEKAAAMKAAAEKAAKKAEKKAAAEAAATKGKQLLAAAAAGSTSDVAQLIAEGVPHDFSEKARTRLPLPTAPHGLTRQA